MIIARPNGSGKSSLVTSAELDFADNRIINPDNYARGMIGDESEYEKYRFAMDMCKVYREELLQGGKSFGFETVASREDKLQFAKKAKSLGYYIMLLFVTAGSPEQCCNRIAQRVAAGGHDVPREKVFSRYERTTAFLPEYIELADHAEVFDNSGDGLVLVLSKKDGRITVFEEASKFEWVGKHLQNYL